MGHIFISYSHTDAEYAHALADSLHGMGLEVWIDARLDYGSQWPLEIQKQLDSCDAFILIMSPRSFASDWVQSELQRAKRKLKPIFPVLLEGDEPWLSVESTQFYDVRNGGFPDNKFYSALKRVVSVSQEAKTFNNMPKPTSNTAPVRRSQPKTNMGIILAVAGGAVLVSLVCLTVLFIKWFPGGTFSPPVVTATVEFVGSVIQENPVVETTPTEEQDSILVSSPTDTQFPPTFTAVPPTLTSTPYPVEITDDRGLTMRLVSAGEFTMGSNNGDTNEYPPHKVKLKAFYMDVYEVTNDEYRNCVDVGKCTSPAFSTLGGFLSSYYDNPQYGDYPVVYVNWLQARTYCAWRGAELPTEAQWEKAARGADGRTYPWGEGIGCTSSNYAYCVGTTSEVGRFRKGTSPYGLYDLSGNVWEWVADWYSETYYQNSPSPSDPSGPDVGTYRILRGGSFVDDENLQRSSFRNRDLPENYNWNIGFRCAKDAVP